MPEVFIEEDGTIEFAVDIKQHDKAISSGFCNQVSSGRFSSFWTYITDVSKAFGPIKMNSRSASNLSRLRDSVKLNGDADYSEYLNVKPHRFQNEGIDKIVFSKRLILADDVGLGKTLQCLSALAHLMNEGFVQRAVVVCPSSIKFQWFDEIHKLIKEKYIPKDIFIVNGTPSDRSRIYNSKWSLLIVNPELLVKDEPMILPKMRLVDFVALDEASCIKNENTRIYSTMNRLFVNADYKIAMTATPIENKLLDINSIVSWVDDRCFFSRAYFDSRYVNYIDKPMTVRNRNNRVVTIWRREVQSYKNLDDVRFKLSPFMLRRTADDVDVQLPEVVMKWELVDISKEQRDVYNSMKVKARDIASAGDAMASLVYLRQACDSTELCDTNTRHQAKVDRLIELLEGDLEGQSVIVFSDYERFIRILQRDLRKFNPVVITGNEDQWQRRAAVDSFCNGRSKLILMTKAGERGLNLQVAPVVVNIDIPWNPASLKQRIGRARRTGSKHKTVRVINMVARRTVEESLVMKRIYEKGVLFNSVVGGDELGIEKDVLPSLSRKDLEAELS